MRTLDLFRPSVGAFAVGMAQAAIDAARRPRRDARTRSAGRSATSRRSRTASPTSPRACRRRGCSSTAPPRAYDRGIRPVTQAAAMAKLLATEVAQEAVDVAIQVHGARALERGPPARAPLPRGAGAADLRGRVGDPARDHRPRAVRRADGGRDEDRHRRRRPRRPVRRDPLQPARRGDTRSRVWERNAADDTFGFGVVFSDETLDRLRGGRPADATPRSRASFARWARHRHPLPRRRRSAPAATASRRSAAARLLEHPPAAAPPGSASTLHFDTEAPTVDELAATHDLVIARRRRQQRRARRARRALRADARPAPVASSCGSAPTSSFDAFTFYIVETEHGVFQVHGYPYDETMSTFIVETDEETWRRAGLDARERTASRRARTTRRASRSAASCSPSILDGHTLVAQQLALAELQHRPQRAAGATATSCCSATPRTPRTSRSARARSSRWRTRSRSPGRSATRRRRPGARSPRTRTSAGRSSRARSAPRRRASSGSRASRATSARRPSSSRSTCSRAAGASRTTTCALRDPGVRRTRRRRVHPRRAQGRRRPAPPADVRAVPPARARARRTASSSRRWTCTRRSTAPSSDFHLVHLGSPRPSAAPALVMTEMICVVAPRAGSRPAAAGCTATTTSTAWRRIVDFVARARHRADRRADRPQRAQGRDEAHVGGDGPAARATAAGRSSAPSPLPYFPDSQVPREMTRADMDRVRDEFVAATRARRRGAASTCSSCTWRTATCCPRSSRRSRTAATDEYGGDAARPRALPARGPRRVPCGAGPRSKPLSRAHLGDRLDPTAASRPTTPSSSRAMLARARLRRRRRLDRPGVARPAAGVRPQLPDAVRRPDPQRGRASRRSRSARSRATRTSTRSILAGRADLCALGRPHLYDPYWTLHAAAEQGYGDVPWIVQYQAGSRRPMDGRLDGPKPPPRSFDPDGERPAGQRWKPAPA